MLEVKDDTRRRSPITQRGYGLGVRPGNYGKRYPAEVLTRDEVERLMAACSRSYNAGIRNRALIVVLWRAGLRVGEAVALRTKDVDLAAGEITILHGKGDRRRVVGIDPQASAVIQIWLERRRKLGIGPGWMFCTITRPGRGGPLSTGYVREAFHELGLKAGIEKRVHPHGLRHTHASELSRENVPILLIKKQLGHANLATTERYVDHLRPGEVIAAMQRRSWGPSQQHEPPPS